MKRTDGLQRVIADRLQDPKGQGQEQPLAYQLYPVTPCSPQLLQELSGELNYSLAKSTKMAGRVGIGNPLRAKPQLALHVHGT